jgi:light-independent protochlorophyllide reductase subunit B
MMGLEEHLLTMFRGDFEFNDSASASHLGTTAVLPEQTLMCAARGATAWAPEAELELGKIPFFVRGKARRNTERFAAERSLGLITVETLYDAKAHYSR